MSQTRFQLEVETTNEAFARDPADEIVRILAHAQEMLRQGHLMGTLRDINGNTVGWFTFMEECSRRSENSLSKKKREKK